MPKQEIKVVTEYRPFFMVKRTFKFWGYLFEEMEEKMILPKELMN